MRWKATLLVLAAAVALSGCVAKSDFLAKVSELDETKKELADEKKKNGDLSAKLADLEKQKAALEKEKTALQQENANIKSTLETSRSQLERDVVALKNKLSENTNRIHELEKDLATTNNHISVLLGEKEMLLQEKERALAQVKGTYDSLVSELKQEIKQGEIQITQLKDKLTVNMVDKILFDSGSAVIKKNGEKVLDRVADILKGVSKQQIKVEGHTDNVPISSRLAEKFPSNWELSTARATTVVRYLQGRGVNPAVLGAEGYAEFRPVASNDTDEGKSSNRRIEIVLIPLDKTQ
jgi:chemotaxis protein MotB